jgi:hypothetical protein
VTRIKWKPVSVRFEIVLILMQYRCTVAQNIPLAQKLLWLHPMELLGDMGHVESRFGPIGDSVSVGARMVYSLR